MERVTISLDDGLLAEFDTYLKGKGYENRSEAIRDLIRLRLDEDRLEEGKADHAVGSLSYVFNHHQRDLAQRLTTAQHAHHDLVLSTLHVHLDHENCLEVAVLQGPTAEVRHFAEATMAETGVRHGSLHLIPAKMAEARHSHAHGHSPEDGHSYPYAPSHRHTRPTT